jgi:hypothetical protein
MNPPPVHPPLPLGLGSYVSLTGIAGAVAAFIIAWVQKGLTVDTVALGVTAAGILAAWAAGRSHQAATLIATVKRDLGAAGIEVLSPPPPT